MINEENVKKEENNIKRLKSILAPPSEFAQSKNKVKVILSDKEDETSKINRSCSKF